jgi:hypothetical protein
MDRGKIPCQWLYIRYYPCRGARTARVVVEYIHSGIIPFKLHEDFHSNGCIYHHRCKYDRIGMPLMV